MSTIDLGHRIEVRKWGTPSATGPTLVLLHHGLGSGATGGDLPARLASRPEDLLDAVTGVDRG